MQSLLQSTQFYGVLGDLPSDICWSLCRSSTISSVILVSKRRHLKNQSQSCKCADGMRNVPRSNTRWERGCCYWRIFLVFLQSITQEAMCCLQCFSPQSHGYPQETFSSVQFSHSVVSDSLQPHELQHARPPCPSPTPGVYSNSCPLSWWCHPTISSSVIPFSSCFQSFPTSGSFQMSQLFTSSGQNIGVSASASVLQWTPRTDLL